MSFEYELDSNLFPQRFIIEKKEEMDVLTEQIKHITQMSADEAGLATAKFIKENLFYLNCIHSAFAIHRNG